MPPILSQQQMQQQHAISYVTTIRNRFANEPDTYRSFLKILHTYQKVRHVSITSAKYCHTRSIPPQPLTHGSLVFTLPMYDNPHANIILNVLNIILISLALILFPSYYSSLGAKRDQGCLGASVAALRRPPRSPHGVHVLSTRCRAGSYPPPSMQCNAIQRNAIQYTAPHPLDTNTTNIPLSTQFYH